VAQAKEEEKERKKERKKEKEKEKKTLAESRKSFLMCVVCWSTDRLIEFVAL